MLRLVRLGKLYQIVSNRNNSNHVVAKLEDLQKNVSGDDNHQQLLVH